MHATEFLNSAPKDIPHVIALVGEERSLKLLAIDAIGKGALGADESPIRFPGQDVELKVVLGELQTIPMWGGKRVVVIEDANDFVTDHRAAVEKYIKKPSKKSLLLLDLKSLAATTNVYKLISANGLIIECTPLKGMALNRWMQDSLEKNYGKTISNDAIALMIQLAGTNIGHLEQELAKLAAYAGDKKTIDAVAVRKLVGDWKTETTWAMTDAVRDGRVADALAALDKLLVAGDTPLKIHGGLAFVFRKLAVATELSRQGMALPQALTQAGAWGTEIQPLTRCLKQIGRPKAELIARKLLEADVNLKGGSSLNDRVQLELLLCRLGGAVE